MELNKITDKENILTEYVVEGCIQSHLAVYLNGFYVVVFCLHLLYGTINVS